KRGPYKRSRYRGLCACGEHAWSVLTQGYVTVVSPEGGVSFTIRQLARGQGKTKLEMRGLCAAYLQKGRQGNALASGDLGQSARSHRSQGPPRHQQPARKPAPMHTESKFCNGRYRLGASGFRGVRELRKTSRWRASIGTQELGTFATAEEAAHAYD